MTDYLTTMSVTYRLTPGFVFAQNKGIGYLLSESDSIAVSSPLYQMILMSIDGVKTDEQIVDLLKDNFNNTEIYYALLRLDEAGYITKNDQNIHSDQLQDTCNDELKSLQNVSIKIVGVNIDESYTAFAKSTLLQAGGDDRTDAKYSIDVVICLDYLDNNLLDLSIAARQNNRYFYPIKISGKQIWFGPLLSPNSQPCWHCLYHRLGMNRPVLLLLNRDSSGKNIGLAPHIYPTNARTGIHLGLNNLFSRIDGQDLSGAKPMLVSYDFQKLSIKKHLVMNWPQCSLCGKKETNTSRYYAPVTLKPCPRSHRSQGGYRTITPTQTWEQYNHLVSPITGIIGKIEPLQPKNHPLRPVWHAWYFRNTNNISTLSNKSLVEVSFGKGCSMEQARASALCEAIERYSAQYHGDEPVIRGTYACLKSKNAVDPRLLMNYSETQYKNRLLIDQTDRTLYVPLPFDEELEISWTPAWSFTNKRQCLVPLSFCYAYTPTPPHEKVCPFCTNGHAAGNTREEAILQGILELVERDATAIWWYNRIPRPEIEIESFNDSYFRRIKRHYCEIGWDLTVFDITHDLQIPTTVSIAYNNHTGYHYIGFGSHLDMHLAIQRSITELNQIFDPNGKQIPAWTDRDLDRREFLDPISRMRKKDASDYKSPPEGDITDDIHYCMNVLHNKGLELIAIDYTRPDIGLPTVKVIVPGMRLFWKRVGPGRLYDVPINMGWLEQPTPEENINPIHLFL